MVIFDLHILLKLLKQFNFYMKSFIYLLKNHTKKQNFAGNLWRIILADFQAWMSRDQNWSLLTLRYPCDKKKNCDDVELHFFPLLVIFWTVLSTRFGLSPGKIFYKSAIPHHHTFYFVKKRKLNFDSCWYLICIITTVKKCPYWSHLYVDAIEI